MVGEFKQGERTDRDGEVAVSIDDVDGSICLRAVDDGQIQSIRVSPFNAARLFGVLAVMLGIRLPSKIGKAIKL